MTVWTELTELEKEIACKDTKIRHLELEIKALKSQVQVLQDNWGADSGKLITNLRR